MKSNSDPINFIPLTCPSCGGELMISAKQDKAICNYCGKPFLVANNLRKDEVTAENLIKLAGMARASKNLGEAYTYYSKALELEPDNIMALYGKALVTGWCSTLHEPRIDEAILYFEKAIEVAPESVKGIMKEKASLEIAQICTSLIMAASDTFKQLINKLKDDLNNYNQFANELEADWLDFLARTYFALDRFDVAINDITESKLKDKMLRDVYEVCNFMLKGVIKCYRIEYNGPITNYVPTQYLRLNGTHKQEMLSRIQNYTSLSCESLFGIPHVNPQEVISFVKQESPSWNNECRLFPVIPTQFSPIQQLTERLFKSTETVMWSMIPPPSEQTRREWGGKRFLLFVLDNDTLLEQGIFIATSSRFIYYKPGIPEKKKLFGVEPSVSPIFSEFDFNEVISLNSYLDK